MRVDLFSAGETFELQTADCDILKLQVYSVILIFCCKLKLEVKSAFFFVLFTVLNDLDLKLPRSNTSLYF